MRNKYPKKIYDSPLESLRKAPGQKKTQGEIADVVGCDLKTYRSWEKGYAYPSTEHLKNLSKLFGVSTDYLLGLSTYRNVGNREISEMTGLTDESIEALRFFNSSFDIDTQKEHKMTVDFINAVFSKVFPSITVYRDSPDEHAPLTTVFSTMMQYTNTKDISISFWEDNHRKTLSGAAATLDFDGDPTGYTVSELGRAILIERIKKALDNMRTDKEAHNGVF